MRRGGRMWGRDLRGLQGVSRMSFESESVSIENPSAGGVVATAALGRCQSQSNLRWSPEHRVGKAGMRPVVRGQQHD